MLRGMPNLKVLDNIICACFQYGKAYKLPYEESRYRVEKLLELVHLDVFGLVKKLLINKNKYMITFINDFSRFVQADFMKEKLEALMKLKEFKEKIEIKVGYKIQCLHTNNEGEYTSKEFTQFLQNYGIRQQLTCPYTP